MVVGPGDGSPRTGRARRRTRGGARPRQETSRPARAGSTNQGDRVQETTVAASPGAPRAPARGGSARTADDPGVASGGTKESAEIVGLHEVLGGRPGFGSEPGGDREGGDPDEPIRIDDARRERADREAAASRAVSGMSFVPEAILHGSTPTPPDASASAREEEEASSRSTAAAEAEAARVMREGEEAEAGRTQAVERAAARAAERATARAAAEARDKAAAGEAQAAAQAAAIVAERGRFEAECAALVAQARVDEDDKVRREEERKAKDLARGAPSQEQPGDLASFGVPNPRNAAEALFAPRQTDRDGDRATGRMSPGDARAEAERFFNFGPARPDIADVAQSGGIPPEVTGAVGKTPDIVATATPGQETRQGLANQLVVRRHKPERERVDIHGRGGIRRTVEVVKVRGGLSADMGPRTKLTLNGPVPMGAAHPFAPRAAEGDERGARHTAMSVFAPKTRQAAEQGKNSFAMIRALIRDNADHGLILTVVRLAAIASRLKDRPSMAGRVRQLIDDTMTSLSRIEGMLAPSGTTGELGPVSAE